MISSFCATHFETKETNLPPAIPADINTSYVGIVDPLNYTEYGSSSNSSENLAFSNTTPGRAYLEVPAQWQTNFLNLSISNLLENRTWTTNTGFEENASGWEPYNNSTAVDYGNATALWVNHTSPAGQNCTRIQMNGERTYWDGYYYYYYNASLEGGFRQRLTIPRGEIINAQLQFDLYPEKACNFASFEVFFYILKNNETSPTYLQSIRFPEMIQYKGHWHNYTFPLYDLKLLDLPSNNTIEFGYAIVFGRGDSEGLLKIYDDEGKPEKDPDSQILYFDNVQLQLQTRAQPSDVNLTMISAVQSFNITDNGWSKGNTTWYTPFPNRTNINPTLQEFQFQTNWTDCTLDWKIEANASSTAEVMVVESDLMIQGIRFTARQNQPTIWDYTIIAHRPARWEIAYHIHMNLSLDWRITHVLDPNYPYSYDRIIEIQGGDAGTGTLEIPQTIAGISGFWKVEAQSPNYNITASTANGANFLPGKKCSVNSAVQFSFNLIQSWGLPENLPGSSVNIDIYHPNGTLFWQANAAPGSDGIVTFPALEIGAKNTSLGEYSVECVWTNGTAVGFWATFFVVQHQVGMRVLIPSNYVSGQNIPSLYGSSIALRVELHDVDANYLVSGIQVSLFLGEQGTSYRFNEVSAGIYDLTLDSSLLPNEGVYACTIRGVGTGVIAQELSLSVDFFVPQTMTWILLSIIAALIISIIGFLVRAKVIVPRRVRAYEELMEITSYYSDARNLVGYIILLKQEGLSIFDEWQDLADQKVDANLISGFLTAISTFGEELPGPMGFEDFRNKSVTATGGKSRIMSMDYQDFVILLLDGEFTRVAAIFVAKPSAYFEFRLRQFAEDFEDTYNMFLNPFAGSVDAFEKADTLFNKYLHFNMTRPIELAEATHAKKLQKNVELTDGEQRMLNVIQTFLKERDYVRLRTVASLYATVTKEEELTAIKGIVGLWLKGMLAPVDPEQSLETALRFFSQEDAEILDVIANGTLNHDVIASEVKSSRNAVDAKMQSFRAWKLINMRDQITEKGRILLERRHENQSKKK